MPQFLFEMALQVSSWANEGRISLEDLPHIMKAFQGNNIEETEDLLKELENYAIRYFNKISANQAANIIIHNGQSI